MPRPAPPPPRTFGLAFSARPAHLDLIPVRSRPRGVRRGHTVADTVRGPEVAPVSGGLSTHAQGECHETIAAGRRGAAGSPSADRPGARAEEGRPHEAEAGEFAEGARR